MGVSTQRYAVGGDLPAEPALLHGLRRGADLVAAAALLLLAAPVLLLCAALVLIESGRPAFFGHRRLGRGGQAFRCWKLRTMVPGAEALLERDAALRSRYVQNGFKLGAGDDPRVTRVGRWLRRRHLDELPQLLNVLQGSMSLVGPRPVVPDELAEYGPHGQDLLRVRPGITGAWTSLGLRRPDYPERARLELDYVRNRSLRGDLGILLRSMPAVLQGAPEP